MVRPSRIEQARIRMELRALQAAERGDARLLGQTNLRPSNERGLRLVKLDDHLPAPTEDFEDPDLVATTVTGKFWRRTGQSIDDHYEEDDSEDEEGNGTVTVVNRFPWVWVYKHEIIPVERFQGEWIPRLWTRPLLICKTAEEIDKNTTGTLNVYWRDIGGGVGKGSETNTGETIEAYMRYADAASDAWCKAYWIQGGWEFMTLECFE